MTFVFVVCCALAMGFVAGLLTFRRSGRWCPTCGRTLHCQDGHAATATSALRP